MKKTMVIYDIEEKTLIIPEGLGSECNGSYDRGYKEGYDVGFDSGYTEGYTDASRVHLGFYMYYTDGIPFNIGRITSIKLNDWVAPNTPDRTSEYFLYEWDIPNNIVPYITTIELEVSSDVISIPQDNLFNKIDIEYAPDLFENLPITDFSWRIIGGSGDPEYPYLYGLTLNVGYYAVQTCPDKSYTIVAGLETPAPWIIKTPANSRPTIVINNVYYQSFFDYTPVTNSSVQYELYSPYYQPENITSISLTFDVTAFPNAPLDRDLPNVEFLSVYGHRVNILSYTKTGVAPLIDDGTSKGARYDFTIEY